MKMERKVSDYSAEKRNGMEMRKRSFAKRKRKRKLFGENRNGNRTVFSGGTDAETVFPFPPNTEFPF